LYSLNRFSFYLVSIGLIGDLFTSCLILNYLGIEYESAWVFRELYFFLGTGGVILWGLIEASIVLGTVYFVYLIRRNITRIPAEVITSSIIGMTLIYIATINFLAIINSII
jgi:hypothetical protein